MSTERRDKAATAYVAPIENFDECVKADHDFKQGWSAYAATMPDREDVEKVLRANVLSDEPAEFDSNIHSWRCGHPEIYGRCSCFQELAAELLALLNKEGEE